VGGRIPEQLLSARFLNGGCLAGRVGQVSYANHDIIHVRDVVFVHMY
jgi:hypothetical protein